MNAQHASRYVLLVDYVYVTVIGFVCKSITSNKEDDNYDSLLIVSLVKWIHKQDYLT